MKKISIILAACLIGICLAGCTSTNEETITYTVQQNEYIKEYVEYSNKYIETKFILDNDPSRLVVEPYRCRYRTVQSILK